MTELISPNSTPGIPQIRPDAQIKKGEPKIVRLHDGRVVARQLFENGNIQDTVLFAPDYPDAPLVDIIKDKK